MLGWAKLWAVFLRVKDSTGWADMPGRGSLGSVEGGTSQKDTTC